MEHTKAQLKTLKAIFPDRSFVLRAKHAILNETRPAATFSRSFTLPTFSWTWISASLSVALVAAIAIIPLAFPKPTFSASLNSEVITNEFSDLPINIQLKEITYEQRMSQTITSAISEVSDTTTKHLNAAIINTEAQNASSSEASTTKDVDALLQQVLN